MENRRQESIPLLHRCSICDAHVILQSDADWLLLKWKDMHNISRKYTINKDCEHLKGQLLLIESKYEAHAWTLAITLHPGQIQPSLYVFERN